MKSGSFSSNTIENDGVNIPRSQLDIQRSLYFHLLEIFTFFLLSLVIEEFVRFFSASLTKKSIFNNVMHRRTADISWYVDAFDSVDSRDRDYADFLFIRLKRMPP